MIQQKLLASEKFSMEIVPTGEEGLVLVEHSQATQPYNLLIVDWMLPGMDGFTVREKVLALPGVVVPKMLPRHGQQLARTCTSGPASARLRRVSRQTRAEPRARVGHPGVVFRD